MVFGVPVLAFKTGAIHEIIDNNKNGFIIRKRSVIKLVIKIIKVAKDIDKKNTNINKSV